MALAGRHCTRRRFLCATAASTVVAALGRSGHVWAEGLEKPRSRKMILSFYCDDTGPHVAGAKAFETFLDYCARQGIAGESSAILGTSGHNISRHPNEEEKAYLRQVGRAKECGIDTHMELMTHRDLFDFDANRQRQDAVHEGLWLHEPGITVEEYYHYFAGIIAEGHHPFFKTRGVVLTTPDLLTLDWPQRAAGAGLTTIATHVTPGEVSRFI